MKQGYVATLCAARGAWLAGDDATAARLADDAAFEARAARDIDAAIEAVELRDMASRAVLVSSARTGWGAR